MILISAALVLAAIVLLIAGVVLAKPFLVMWSIVISVLSAVSLLIGALVRRHELFPAGGRSREPVDAMGPMGQPVPPAYAATGQHPAAGTMVAPTMRTTPTMPGVPPMPPHPSPSGPPTWDDRIPPATQVVRPNAAPSPATGPEGLALDAIVLVIPGRRRFHLATCRQLLGRETEELTHEEAREEGFTPCTTCLPDGAPPRPTSATSSSSPSAPSPASGGPSSAGAFSAGAFTAAAGAAAGPSVTGSASGGDATVEASRSESWFTPARPEPERPGASKESEQSEESPEEPVEPAASRPGRAGSPPAGDTPASMETETESAEPAEHSLLDDLIGDDDTDPGEDAADVPDVPDVADAAQEDDDSSAGPGEHDGDDDRGDDDRGDATVTALRPGMVRVLVGTRRYHGPDCPLLSATDDSDIEVMTQAAAEEAGLTHCSVCDLSN